jgi:L-iditol 2-dehydrogenase
MTAQPMAAGPGPGRSARLHGARDVRLHDEPVPPIPADGRVLVRVTAVGLCGSDLHWYVEGAIGETRLASPLVMGHEFAGVIEGGPRHGERVAVDPADPCERCDLCRSGRGHLCGNMRFAGLSPDDGALQTHLAWPASRCVLLPASIADHQAPLLETLGIAIHAMDLAPLRPGMTVGVYGAGPVGLVLIRALRAGGIRTIVATDRLPHRVQAAAESGATTTLLVGEGPDPAAAVEVDIAFECAGDPAALDTAIRAVRPGGHVMLVGIPNGDATVFPSSAARRKELTLRNVRRMEAADLSRAVGLVRSGAVSLEGLVTHRFALEEAPAAFALLAERRGLKIVVEPGAPA